MGGKPRGREPRAGLCVSPPPASTWRWPMPLEWAPRLWHCVKRLTCAQISKPYVALTSRAPLKVGNGGRRDERLSLARKAARRRGLRARPSVLCGPPWSIICFALDFARTQASCALNSLGTGAAVGRMCRSGQSEPLGCLWWDTTQVSSSPNGVCRPVESGERLAGRGLSGAGVQLGLRREGQGQALMPPGSSPPAFSAHLPSVTWSRHSGWRPWLPALQSPPGAAS